LKAEGRKSVEPMAAVTAPAQVSVQHQNGGNQPSNSVARVWPTGKPCKSWPSAPAFGG
jgi:hypothetical protein